MRSLSLTFREAINADSSDEVPIHLVTIDHPDADAPITLSTDPTERVSDVPLIYKTVSRGTDFFFCPMSVLWPDETDEAAPSCQLRIMDVANRDARILARSVITPGTAMIELVLASSLDDVEASTPFMDIVRAQMRGPDLLLDFALNSMAQEPYPCDTFSPPRFPGLFTRG